MPDVPMEAKFQEWPRDMGPQHPDKIVELYKQGFIGAYNDPAGKEVLMQTIKDRGGHTDGESAAYAYGLPELGKGKLCLTFLAILALFPFALPGPAQECGDCVSHDTKNAALTTMCCDIVGGMPDEKTGRIEGAPIVSDLGHRNGVLSTEADYWWRGFGGDGWSCPVAANVVMKNGIWLRRDYTSECGVDLTTYSGHNAHAYGSRQPPAAFAEIGRQHVVYTATDVKGKDQLRDFIYAGYGISTCGGEGFSSTRDANGVSGRSGNWSHAMAIMGFDDRKCIWDLYKEPLCLVQNSWNRFNSGPRTIFGTTIQIPEGSFWTPWSNVRNREFIAFGGVNGFAPRKIHQYSSGILG